MGCSCSKSSVSPSSVPRGDSRASREKVITPAVSSTSRVKDGEIVSQKEEPLVLEFTPPAKLRPYSVEEHFWEHKKKLIPDYGRMLVLDDRALKAPASLKVNPQDLVSYLTQGLTSELEKVRVLIRWMGDNIEYDTEFLKTGVRGDCSIEAVLRTGRSVCQGYSDVLAHFCKLADIECNAIAGVSKGAGYYPGTDLGSNPDSDHAWNRVQIQGTWYLCDPTWAAGAVDNDSGQQNYIKKWNEAWFLTHPEAFLSTHLPYKQGEGVLPSEQLVSKPVSSVQKWNDRVRSDPMVHAYKMQPVSHQQSVINTRSAELSIVFNNPATSMMRHWTELTPYKTGQKYNDMVMIYSRGNKIQVDVRLPGKGSYCLKILGTILTPDWPNDKKDDTPVHSLFWYRINCEAANPSQGFLPSGSNAEWGMTSHYQAAGFQLISPKSAVIQTKKGRCEVQVKLPIAGVVTGFHTLHHAQANTSELEPCVYAEKTGRVVTYHIRCPYQGEYRFEIWYNPAETANVGYYNGAAFLIKCKKPDKDAFCYTDSQKLGGPLPEFHTRYGLKSGSNSSTLKLRDGKVDLTIHKTRPVKIFAKLQARKGESQFVSETSTADATTFQIEPPGNGIHFCKLYASEESEKSGNLVATYCVTE